MQNLQKVAPNPKTKDINWNDKSEEYKENSLNESSFKLNNSYIITEIIQLQTKTKDLENRENFNNS
jgi:hypothetical protein